MDKDLIFRWVLRSTLGAVLVCCALPADAKVSDDELAGFLTAGRAALEDGLPSVAEKQLRRYINLARKRKDLPAESEAAGILLARALHAQEKYDDILEFLKPRDRWVKKWAQQDAVSFWRGMALHGAGRADEALAEITKWDATSPDNRYEGRIDRLKAWCLLKQKRVDEAVEAFAVFDKHHPDSPEHGQNLLDWGKALVGAARYSEARAVLERLDPKRHEPSLVRDGRFWLGGALKGEGTAEKAVEVFLSVAGDEAAPAELRARAYRAVAEVEEHRRRLSEAVVALRTGMELAGDTSVALGVRYNLGRLLLQQGRHDEAVPLLKAAITADPGSETSRHAQLTLGNALLQGGRHAEAAEEFQYYLETYTDRPGQADAASGRGSALFAQGRLAESAMAFEKAFGLYSNDVKRAQSLFRQGDAYLGNSQHGLAAEAYAKVVDLFPDSKLAAGALYQRGESLARSGNEAEAEALFRSLTESHPDHAVAEEAMHRLAGLKEDTEAWQEAIDIYDGAMTTYSNGLFYAEALYGRGSANFRLFRFALALADFERIGRQFSDSVVAERAAFKQAMCLHWIGRDGDAIAVCHAFAEARPDSELLPDVLYWLGKSTFNSGAYVAAEEHFATFQSKFDDHPLADDSLLWAGRAAARQNEYVRAIETLAKMFKLYPDSDKMAEGRFAQADAFVELANYSAAILLYDEIINKYSESGLLGPAWGRKGDCQFTLGAEDPKRYQESIESYRVVANSPDASPDEVLQASYKIGRCLEKMDRIDEALEQYYAKVIVQYLRESEKGVWHNEAAKVWFTRAAFSTADILESREDWRGTVRILERVAKADVPAADEARERIGKIRSDRWWLFY
jgi:TolA-binding protein